MPELVVIAEQLFADVPGGTGRYTSELLGALAATAPRDWTVGSVVCRHRDVSRAVVDGVSGPRVLPLPRRALVALWQSGVRYWPGGDAVHAPTPFAPPGKPGKPGKPGGRPATLTVTVHDTVPWTHPETLTPRGVRWHRGAIARAMRTADAVVVPTQAVADDLATRISGPSPIRVIPHGVSVVFKTTNGASEVLKTPTPPRVAPQVPESYVLAIGTLEPRKGIDVLIAAVGALHRRGEPAPTVLLAGQPGWGGLNPLEQAAAEGLPAGSVRVLGRLEDAELAAVLRAASVLVAPSRAEGFGLPVAEAMAAGVPVIHSDAPALVEVAGGAGVVVPRGDVGALANALRTVLADGAEARRLAAAGKLRAAEFSWDSAAESLWRLHTDP